MIKFKFKYKYPVHISRDESRRLTIIESQFFRIETDKINFKLDQEEGEDNGK